VVPRPRRNYTHATSKATPRQPRHQVLGFCERVRRFEGGELNSASIAVHPYTISTVLSILDSNAQHSSNEESDMDYKKQPPKTAGPHEETYLEAPTNG